MLKRLRKGERLRNEDKTIDGTRIGEDPYIFVDPGEYGTSRVVFLRLLFLCTNEHVRTLDVSGPVKLLKGRHVLRDSLDIRELLDSSPHPLVCGPICVAINRRLGTQFLRSLVNLGQKAVLLFRRTDTSLARNLPVKNL